MKTFPLTFCISTYNNLNYLKLSVESVRKYSFFKDAPFIIHAENCNDGTNEWLENNKDKYNLEIYIENNKIPIGIGGGMNFCAEKVKTEFIMFLHSDFVVSENWDLNCLNVFEKHDLKEKLWVFSHRMQPNIFKEESRPGTLIVNQDAFGSLYDDFKLNEFIDYAKEFIELNKDYSIPKPEGVSGLIRKKDWDYIGGNDPLFAPTSFDDVDLFLRMKIENYKFILTGNSLVWHFGARGSHRLEENNGVSSSRQIKSEISNKEKWEIKWFTDKIPNNFIEFDSNLELRNEVLKMLNLNANSNLERLKSLNIIYNILNLMETDYINIFGSLYTVTYAKQYLHYHGSQIKSEFICTWVTLYEKIKTLNDKEIKFLEIGAFRGLWALMFHRVCVFLNKTPIYTTVTIIDESDKETYDIYNTKSYLNNLNQNFTIINNDSNDVNNLISLDSEYNIVFIDANHTYDYVNADIQIYSKLAKNVLFFHDIKPEIRNNNCGVYDAIKNNNIELDIKYSTNDDIMGIGICFTD